MRENEQKKRRREERAENRARDRKLPKKDEELQEDREASAERLSECCAISLGSQLHQRSIARGKIWMMD